MADFADLIVPVDEDEILQQELNLLELQEFPVTAYQEGTVARTLLQAFANVQADAWFALAQIARGATLDTAEGAWLDLLAASQYDETRQPAEFAAGTVRLTDGGGGPHTIAAGDLYVATSSGLRYRNTTGGTLALGGTLDLSFRAEFAGSAYNVANGAISELVTALSTVTVSNPAVGSSGTWITTLGSDAESDASFRARCRSKWGALSTGSPKAAYVYWALSQSGVTRASVDDANPDGPGSLRVYVDSSGAVAATQSYIDARSPVGSLVTAMSATTTTISLIGTVYVRSEYRERAQTQLEANLAALAASTDIGGTVYRSALIEQMMSPDGVVNVALSSGIGDTVLGASAIPSIDVTGIAYVEV